MNLYDYLYIIAIIWVTLSGLFLLFVLIIAVRIYGDQIVECAEDKLDSSIDWIIDKLMERM